MKLRTAILVASLALLSACSHGWTRNDTYRQAAVAGLQVIDWRQSRTIATEKMPSRTFKHPGSSSVTYDGGFRWEEYNPILGDRPSRDRVDAYFAASIAGHALVSWLLPPKYRAGWQYIGIGFECAFIFNNFSAGVRW